MPTTINDKKFINSIPRVNQVLTTHRNDEFIISRWKIYDLYITFIYVVKPKFSIEIILDSSSYATINNKYIVPAIFAPSIYLKLVLKWYLSKALKNIPNKDQYKQLAKSIINYEAGDIRYYVNNTNNNSKFIYLETERNKFFEYDKKHQALVSHHDTSEINTKTIPIYKTMSIDSILDEIDKVLSTNILKTADIIEHSLLHVRNYDGLFEENK